MNAHNINRIYLMSEALGCKFTVNPPGRYIVFMDQGELYKITISFEQFLAVDHFVLRSSISAQFELMKEAYH